MAGTGGAGLPAYLRLVRADNPGPMTLEGTNTWLVGDPAEGPLLVVDPGPVLPGHAAAVRAATGGRVGAVVLTHRHLDHAEAAAALAAEAGCPVLALDPALRVGDGGLGEGRVVRAGAVTLTAVPTPGHTSDSCCLLLRGPDGAVRLLTGDTVLGRGSTVVAAPDGDLGDYLASLARLAALVEEHGVVELLPGHGDPVADPAGWLADCRRHREERLQQVRDAVAAGDGTVEQVLSRVYADVDPAVLPAARQSVEAQLRFLAAGRELS